MARIPQTYDGRTVTEIAEELQRPRRTVQSWIKEGMPTSGKAMHDWVAERNATAAKRPRGAVHDDPNGVIAQIKAEELTFRKLKNKDLTVRIAERQKILIPVEQAKRANAEAMQAVKQSWLEQARTVSAKVMAAESADEVRDILEQDTTRRLERLAGGRAV